MKAETHARRVTLTWPVIVGACEVFALADGYLRRLLDLFQSALNETKQFMPMMVVLVPFALTALFSERVATVAGAPGERSRAEALW